MRRDLDLVRALLFKLENAERWMAGRVQLDGYSDEEVYYHLQLLIDAGLVQQEKIDSELPYKRRSGYRLTWAGHEFLDAAREPKRWQLAKAKLESVGGVAFDVLKALLTDLAKKQMGLD